VKLLRVEKDHYTFRLGHHEKGLFEFMLRLYPVIPSAHQSLSKTPGTPDQGQRLLDEALAEQRKENKKQVEALLADTKRYQEGEHGPELTLTAGEIEWVLQVLNDVRVGNWILLGSPEEEDLRFEPDSESAPRVIVMHFAGKFQMELLEAIRQN
jgi:hypothetical protein